MFASTSFLRKLLTSLVTGITFIALLLMLGNGGNIKWFPAEIVFPLAAIAMLFSIAFPIYWHLREKPVNIEHSSYLYASLYAFTRYCLAFNVASFGWKKIFGLQFIVPVEIASQPMNTQSGEWLTWFYFGHSFAFGLIIALLQIGGASLLLFRRTQLLALFILLGVMLNLTLINIFYQMNAGALLQSVSITIGIVFLLLLDYHKIIAFFFQPQATTQSVLSGKPVLKNLVRVSAILISLLFTLYLSMM